MRNIIVVCGAAVLDYILYVDDGNPFFVVGYIEAGLQVRGVIAQGNNLQIDTIYR